MKNYTTGIYRLKTVVKSDIIWYKDLSPAIPFKYEYSQLFFNQIDKIALAESIPPQTLIALCAVYEENDNFYLDYGHWEILMILMLFSLLGEKLQSESNRNQLIYECLQINNNLRLNWKHIDKFFREEVLALNLTRFIKKADEELSAVEKVLRDIAEAVWEYVNCIATDSDEKIMDFVDKLLENAVFMVVIGGNSDESLEAAASMYGSFGKLLATDLNKLDNEWKYF